MPAPEPTRLLVIGGGPAGYTSSLYAARSGLQPVCLEGYDAGGQISRSFLVENYPGAPDGTSGADLAQRIRDQAQAFGARVVTDDVVSVDLSRRPFLVSTHASSYAADAVVIATGSVPRALGLPGEQDLIGRGIAYCAICDGAFFAGSKVIVVGGGNAALGEALAMDRVAAEVTLLHRRNEFRADAAVETAVRGAANIRLRTPFVIEDLVSDGQGNLCGVRVRDASTAQTTYLATDGLFIAIGHLPASAPFRRWVEVDENGCIVTASGSTATSLPGVFAAGDVADARYRQAITAAASGCMAAMDAEHWLVTGEHPDPPPAAAQADRPDHTLTRQPNP